VSLGAIHTVIQYMLPYQVQFKLYIRNMYNNFPCVFTNNVRGILSADEGKATRKYEKPSIVFGYLISLLRFFFGGGGGCKQCCGSGSGIRDPVPF
jgi:hypothetical protein